jgi:hypothetical protein
MAVNTIYNTPLTGQVGSFNPVVMSTPGADGNYRASLYIWAPTFGQANKDIIVNITWTDPSGVMQTASIGLFTSNTGVNSARLDTGSFRALGGTNITMVYGVNSNDPTDSYNLYPNLEQL